MKTTPNSFELPVPEDLRHAWKIGKLVLFLGSGISQPYGLPNWNDLVLTLLLDESSRAFDQFWPHYRVPLASWLAETFGLSPVAIARLARARARSVNYNDDRFRSYLRDELYRFQRQPEEPTALTGIVELLFASEKDVKKGKGWHIPVVATFNFDDLLERKLSERGIHFETIFQDTRRTDNKLYILHVHGYLPSADPIPEADIVFTEDEYHRLSFSTFHWSQIDLVNLLRNYTVLFVGLSMSDPNLRRLLDVSHARTSGSHHLLLRKKYPLSAEERARARETITAAAQRQAKKLNLEGAEKSADALDRAISDMLDQAHQYDTELLQDMGVGTIWFEDFSQIPTFLSNIPEQANVHQKPARTRKRV
jgi:hypothetical protein